MKCPVCGGAELVHDTRDMPYTYKDKSTTLPAVTGDYCPACDEVILDMYESRRTSALMHEFTKHGKRG
ncbi:MAG: type II toxin-antitoxin system MqsA family antitoxin [Gammaproteobacteria bacterium]|nr:type II toxin-antitoxin system MqsA family antitoxin [Gammaproteobacteria bacterium]